VPWLETEVAELQFVHLSLRAQPRGPQQWPQLQFPQLLLPNLRRPVVGKGRDHGTPRRRSTSKPPGEFSPRTLLGEGSWSWYVEGSSFPFQSGSRSSYFKWYCVLQSDASNAEELQIEMTSTNSIMHILVARFSKDLSSCRYTIFDICVYIFSRTHAAYTTCFSQGRLITTFQFRVFTVFLKEMQI
jgi:hypothetical protein